MVKSLKLKQIPLVMASRITSIPDYKLYEQRRQFEVTISAVIVWIIKMMEKILFALLILVYGKLLVV